MSLYDALPEKSYLKKLLTGIDADVIEKFLQIKNNYETVQEKEDKRMYKDKMTGVFWEIYVEVAKMINPELSTAKRLFLRYGLTDLRYLSPKDQEFILNQPISPVNYDTDVLFYADEWLQGVVDGKIKASSVDETSVKVSSNKPGGGTQVSARQEKYVALIEVENGRLEGFKKARSEFLNKMSTSIELLKQTDDDVEEHLGGVFSKDQVKALDELLYFHKEVKKLNKEIFTSVRTIQKAQSSLDARGEDSDESGSDGYGGKEKILSEVSNIRQMTKMTIGRQGNSFPYLTSLLLSQEPKTYLFKETVKKKLNYWMDFDPKVFQRTYKNEEMNIVPYMVLVPGAGSTGICWEPLDTDNKQFGRGRIALPIFTRTPDMSLLTALGDIRWQSAKEIASYYWMEEGLTGHYYDYIFTAKLKGDLRLLFIKDYLLWMTKEIQGVQKLEQDARYVFWRYVPLPDQYKIALSKKGYYYNQLWEKEQVWRRSGK